MRLRNRILVVPHTGVRFDREPVLTASQRKMVTQDCARPCPVKELHSAARLAVVAVVPSDTPRRGLIRGGTSRFVEMDAVGLLDPLGRVSVVMMRMRDGEGGESRRDCVDNGYLTTPLFGFAGTRACIDALCS